MLKTSNTVCARRLRLILIAAAAALAAPASAMAAQYNCVILPDAVVEVSSGTSGRIETIGVERGDVVAEGQLLASLESGVEKANVALARARAAIDTEIRLREARLRFDRRRHDRIQSLFQQAASSSQERDDADSEAVLSRWLLQQAQDNQRLAELELERAEQLLVLRMVRSPISGVVVERYRWPGEFVEDQPIVGVARLDPLRVEVIVPVAQHGDIIRRMQARILPETSPDEPRTATVTLVDPMGDPASGTFRVVLALPNPGNQLLGGIKCLAEFLPESRAAALAAKGAETVTSEPVRIAPVQSAARLVASADRVDPTSVESGWCRRLGPLEEGARVDALSAALSQAGARVSSRQSQEQMDNGYLVLAAPDAGESVWQLENRLRAAGITDLMVMGRGDFAGSVALGAYDRKTPATRRRDGVRTLGFNARVAGRTRSAQVWWLDVSVPGKTGDLTRVAHIVSTAARAVTPCDDTLTAGIPDPAL